MYKCTGTKSQEARKTKNKRMKMTVGSSKNNRKSKCKNIRIKSNRKKCK